MPPQYARGKAQSLASSWLNELPGRLDDLQEAAGDPEVADGVGCQPFEVVVFVVQDRLPGGPARRKRNDQVMPAPLGLRQHLAPPGELQNLDSKPGFLVDLAMQRRVQRFAEFDP